MVIRWREKMTFNKQQTIETIRSNLEMQQAVWDATSEEKREAERAAYKAEKIRKYKIRLINEWRAKS